MCVSDIWRGPWEGSSYVGKARGAWQLGSQAGTSPPCYRPTPRPQVEVTLLPGEANSLTSLFESGTNAQSSSSFKV